MWTDGGGGLGSERTGRLFLSQAFGILFANFITWLQLCLMSMWMVRVMPLVVLTLVQYLIAIAFILLARFVNKRLIPPERLFVIYGDYPVESILNKLKSRPDRFEVVKTLPLPKGEAGLAALLESLPQDLKEGRFNSVVLWDLPNQERNDLLKACYGKGIRVYLMPKITDVIIKGMVPLHIFDTPILMAKEYPLALEERAAKRAVDVLCSVLLLILASPIMLITAVAIKLYDKGPVIYSQERITLNGRAFRIYKFRSMSVTAEKDGVARLAGKNDSRITPIGHFIRAVRIDELPQLVNILKGDMSFIGPRPERPELIREYVKEMPEFEFRTRVKAGLAGYAQVYGKYNTTPYDKLKLDLYYIENYSFWLDLQLMLLTLKILFTPDATEGV
ncbi:MAG: sugar transferase, partial [Lachnospiraceae bacterium]|nr:sugar transferase [Lachnospiraceae bacterium]